MLLKAVVTEKSMKEAQNKRYTFAVTLAATKPRIKRAVEEIFGVKVLKVHTLRLDDVKKAIVQIDPKQSIDLWKKD
ncbi:MAG: 50S ribosomal protein L23 [Patescibacteria group bacterium]